MFIDVLDLEREPLEFDETIEPGAIEYSEMIRQVGNLHAQGRADLIREHHGPHESIEDVRLRAEFEGNFEVACARCLDPVDQHLHEKVDLLFRPAGADGGAAERAISTSDTEIGYYQEGGLALEDVLREQVLISLPAKTLCRQDCKGLCPGCGKNLNSESCTCDSAPPDARWSALSDLRNRLKQ
jgi:uncharacterized protein